MSGPAEAQGIQGGDDLAAHAVDVAHDAADARGRALDGHDLAGMVVALVGEDDAVLLAVDLAEVDDARVLHRPDDHVVAGGRQVGLQVGPAALVGAVLAPHGVEEGHLGQGGIAAEQFGHLAGLARRQGQAVFLEVGSQGNDRRNHPRRWVKSSRPEKPWYSMREGRVRRVDRAVEGVNLTPETRDGESTE